jgi:hypothetical protein
LNNLFCMLPNQAQAPIEIPEEDVPQDQLWNALDRGTQLEKIREILKSHERIGERILELRREEGMRLPGGFQVERLVEILEENYGGEKLLDIEIDMMQKGILSPYYNETKTFFFTSVVKELQKRYYARNGRGRLLENYLILKR